MATLQDLMDRTAQVLDLPPLTVHGYARSLREAGWLPASKGGRGHRGGSEVQADHMAALLLGILASPTAKDAPHAVNVWGEIKIAEMKERTERADGAQETDRSAEFFAELGDDPWLSLGL